MATAIAPATQPPDVSSPLLVDRRRARQIAARAVRGRLRLPPKITGSEWADRNRVLAPPAAQPGRWITARAEYLREILDTVCGREYPDTTIVKCSQSGGSEVLINAVGFFVDQEPSSILVIQPNVKPMAEDFSKDRIAPLFRDSPVLRDKVRDPRARDSGNTILHKAFVGGHLTIAGANSPAGLASRPIRVVLADEIDRWTKSAGTEGDPLSLAAARQTTYRHRRKTAKVSSPGNEDESRIQKEWELSDQRHYHVPCPHCQHMQPLEWRDSGGHPDIRPGRGEYRLMWEKEGDGDDVVHKPETAAYVCRSCAALIEEHHKPWMLARGRWVKHNPRSDRAGFHIPGLISPWIKWSEIAADFLAKKDDPEQLKTFFNTKLGLLYVPMGEEVNADTLEGRREDYGEGVDVPLSVGLLTASIDVQGDRLEVDVWGWGAKEEAWHIRLERLYGDPEQQEVWQRAEAILSRPWTHASGATLRIRATMVDTGYLMDAVYRFVQPRQGRGVYAYKGVENAKSPISRAVRANRDKVKVFSVNPNVFKDILFYRLKRQIPGAGYMHYGTEEQTGADHEYFQQYAAEKRIVDFVNNSPVVSYKKIRRRNESIDHYVMNLSALRALGMNVSQRLHKIVAEVQAQGAEIKGAEVAKQKGTVQPETPPPRAPRRGGFVNAWKR